MSDKKISDLVELTTLAADDVLPVVDSSANATKRVTYDTLSAEVRDDVTPADFTLTSGDLPAGSIVQVVNERITTAVTVSTETYTDTGLEASITPTSASNKVLVLFTQNMITQRDARFQGSGLRFFRVATQIWQADEQTLGANFYYAPSDQYQLTTHVSASVLDSPSTTSAVTYKMKGRPRLSSTNGTVIYQWGSEQDSTITLMEVVA